MGEGFFNRGCIVVEKNPILDMKGLSYSMSHLFDYLRDVPCLSRAQVFSSIFQVPLVHPWATMDADGTDLGLMIGA